MIIKRIEGATRVLGESQGYLGLPVRDQVGVYLIDGQEERCHEMVTAWEPTPDEIELIKAGATIYLSVLGISHPPVNITVGEAPSDVQPPKAQPTRISVDPADPGFANNFRKVRVLFDGVEQKGCVTADSKEGWIKRYVTDPDDKLLLDGSSKPRTEICHGSVLIIWPER